MRTIKPKEIMRQKLSKETLEVIEDLRQDLIEMLKMESNIEVIWRLEKLQNDKAFQKSADFIRRSITKQGA